MSSKKGNAIGIIIGIWSLMTIISIPVLLGIISNIDDLELYTKIAGRGIGIIIGQFFFFLGIVASFYNKKIRNKLFCLIFTLVGGIILFVVMYNMVGGENIVEIISYVFAILSLLVGIGLIILPKILNKIDTKSCTLGVWAKCVEYEKIIIKKQHSPGNYYKYSPILEYTVNGNKYTWSSSVCVDKSLLPEKGEEMYIYVNPDDPNNAYIDINKDDTYTQALKNQNKNKAIVGVLFVITSLCLLGVLMRVF